MMRRAHLRLFVLCMVLLIVACGREAPPRAANPTPAPPTPLPTQPQPAQAPPVGPDGRAQGDPNAPITVIEYGDFQCPYCDAFVRETKPQIEAQYIETGKVYFVFRDFPLSQIHPGALLAAHVANCAGDQGSFWPMHDRLFIGQGAGEWGSGDASDFNIFLGYAQELSLDRDALRSCVETNQHAPQISADIRDAVGLGMHSTPSFLVNGKPLIGAQPYTVWRQVFDDLLAGQ